MCLLLVRAKAKIKRNCNGQLDFFDCGRVLFGSRVAKREAEGTVHTKHRLNLHSKTCVGVFITGEGESQNKISGNKYGATRSAGGAYFLY